MLIYFEGPPEHQGAALAASQYECTDRASYYAEADAVVLVWDGRDPLVKALLSKPLNGKLRYVYRIPDE